MFGVDGQPEYAPEDELAGEMEMAAAVQPAYARTAEAGITAFGGVEGGMGATLPVGAHREGRAPERVRSGPMNDWQVAEKWQRERAQEAERRRADAEMSRNFGQEVGASTRGRGSHSPWRASTHASPPVVAAQQSSGPQPSTSLASTGALGFRSSSSRPFAAASRLVGIGGTYGSSVAPAPGGQTDARRGYGVSAPSTQFHYQPTHSAPRPTPNSYPVSRDEMYDDDEEDEEEEDDDGMRRC